MFKVDFDHPQWAHFMGIGGISMSSLAQFLLSKGFKVTGSDTKQSKNTDRLEKLGARIAYHQGAENIEDGIDFCVNTAAVHPDNPEYVAALEKGIPILNRAELLGQMMAHYPESFAISGTHGKTTTTGMVTEILLAADDDPTVSIGGLQESIGGNLRIGHSPYFVAEACEFTNSYHHMFPKTAIILNIRADHLDFFHNMENIRKSFRHFAENVAADGVLIVESDIEDVHELMAGLPCRVVYAGLQDGDDYQAKHVEESRLGECSFDFVRRGETLGRISLNVPGEHNVTNALSAGAAAMENGIPFEAVKTGLNALPACTAASKSAASCARTSWSWTTSATIPRRSPRPWPWHADTPTS